MKSNVCGLGRSSISSSSLGSTEVVVSMLCLGGDVDGGAATAEGSGPKLVIDMFSIDVFS